MPADEQDGDGRLASLPPTPIALLHPGLDHQAGRVVHGEITITWPFNRVKNTFAFLLAEPDVRLRRVKGQVRVELHGASARAVANSGLGGGDTVILSLDGVEWVKDESPGRIPGARLDWQFQFTEKIKLQARFGESGEVKRINVDHPEPESSAPVPVPSPIVVEPEVPDTPVPAPATARKAPVMDTNEYPSPAFIKRARMSYGALFEDGLDIFEDDGGVKGKGRKRTRFGRDSSAWRYTSQSPSPEPSPAADDSISEDVSQGTQTRPEMRDEAAQTAGSDTAILESETPMVIASSIAPENPGTFDQEVRDVHTEPVAVSEADSKPSHDHPSTVAAPETHGNLFGALKPQSAGFSMFGTTAPSIQPESAFSLADQVRFGFSHIPESPGAALPKSQPSDQTIYPNQGDSIYPETYLQTHGPAELDTLHGSGMGSGLSLSSDMAQTPWDPSAQSYNYPPPDSNQYGMGAFDEGQREAPEASIGPLGTLPPTTIPEGFSSYGQPMVLDLAAREVGGQQMEQYAPQGMRGAEDAEPLEEAPSASEDDVKPESEIESDIEEGDYDQRNYENPEDDEGVPGEEELQQDRELIYDDEYSYDEDEEEDGYGEQWDEEEEDAEGDEDDDPRGFAPHPPPRPANAAPAAPVVISLLSDSEDEGEEPPKTAHRLPPNLAGEQRPSLPSRPSIEDLADAAQHHGSSAAKAPAAQIRQADAEPVSFLPAHGRVQVVDFAPGLGGSFDADVAEGSSSVHENANMGGARDIAVDLTSGAPQGSGPHFGDEDVSLGSEHHSQFSDDEYSDSLEDEDTKPDNQRDSANGSLTYEKHAAKDDSYAAEIVDIEDSDESEDDEPGDAGASSLLDTVEPDDETSVADGEFSEQPEEDQDQEMIELDAPSPSNELVEESAGKEDVISQASDVQMGNNDLYAMEEDLQEQALGSASNAGELDAGESTAGSRNISLEPKQPDAEAMTQSSLGPTPSFQSQPPSVLYRSPSVSRPASKEGSHNAQFPTPMESQVPAQAVSEVGQLVEEVVSVEQATGDSNHSMLMAKLVSTEVEVLQIEAEPSEEPTDLIVGDLAEERAQDSATTKLPEGLPVQTAAPGDDEADNAPANSLTGKGVEHDTTSVSNSVVMSGAEQEEGDSQESPPSVRRSARHRQRSTPIHSSPGAKDAAGDHPAYHTRSHDANMSPRSEPSSPDLSIQLARKAAAAKRPKKAPEPFKTSPRVTRARSSSLQRSVTSEADEEEDASIGLARAALASPFNANPELAGSTATLRQELMKRIRSHRECIPLKSLQKRLNEHPDVLAIVTTKPPPAVRAKGGPREYLMSFNVTDPSTAPNQVVEVQLYRPHKESLPIVEPGDAILLQKFQVKSFTKKGFGLRSHEDSAWAVFDEKEDAPQIRGPPVEDWEQYSEYMKLLTAWYRSFDEAAKGKVEKVNKKMEDATGQRH